MSEEKTTKQLILDTVIDCFTDLLYYDRKEDEDLPVGAIEKAILSGEITVDEIVDKFRDELEKSVINELEKLMIDYSRYPPNWKTEIRPAVLARANNCCEECGVPNYAIIYRPIKGQADWEMWPEGMEGEALWIDGVKSVKIILTIAHLDNDPTNHDVKLDRLKALCQRCHLRLDKNLHIQNRKYGSKHKENNIKIEFEQEDCMGAKCTIENCAVCKNEMY